MTWEIAFQTLETPGTVEYGAFQREALPGTPLWRRHTKGLRFPTVAAALFNKQGAMSALNGIAPYAKERYAVGDELHMPYVAAWLRGATFAFLARASTPEPEVTIVSTSALDIISFETPFELTNHLANIFGEGAAIFGIRFLSARLGIVER